MLNVKEGTCWATFGNDGFHLTPTEPAEADSGQTAAAKQPRVNESEGAETANTRGRGAAQLQRCNNSSFTTIPLLQIQNTNTRWANSISLL